jgi:hypothetical protein
MRELRARWRREKEASSTRSALKGADRAGPNVETRPSAERAATWRAAPSSATATSRASRSLEPPRRNARRRSRQNGRHAQGGGRRRGHRRGRLQVDRHPGVQAARERARASCSTWRTNSRPRGRARMRRSRGLRTPSAAARAGLSDPNRPIGSFLFLGADRRGQDRAGKALAEFLFDDERAMVRIDMSSTWRSTRRAADRRASRLRRLRRGRPAHRGGAASALLGGAASTRSRRPTPTSSTCCCRCSTTAA